MPITTILQILLVPIRIGVHVNPGRQLRRTQVLQKCVLHDRERAPGEVLAVTWMTVCRLTRVMIGGAGAYCSVATCPTADGGSIVRAHLDIANLIEACLR